MTEKKPPRVPINDGYQPRKVNQPPKIERPSPGAGYQPPRSHDRPRPTPPSKD